MPKQQQNCITYISENKIKIKVVDPAILRQGILYFIIVSGLIVFLLFSGLKLNVMNTLAIIMLVVFSYIAFFRVLLFNLFSKKLELTENHLLVNKRRYQRDKLMYVSVQVGSANSIGLTSSYTVTVVLKKWLLNKVLLCAFHQQREAIKTAEEIAAFLKLEVQDNTRSA